MNKHEIAEKLRELTVSLNNEKEYGILGRMKKEMNQGTKAYKLVTQFINCKHMDEEDGIEDSGYLYSCVATQYENYSFQELKTLVKYLELAIELMEKDNLIGKIDMEKAKSGAKYIYETSMTLARMCEKRGRPNKEKFYTFKSYDEALRYCIDTLIEQYKRSKMTSQEALETLPQERTEGMVLAYLTMNTKKTIRETEKRARELTAKAVWNQEDVNLLVHEALKHSGYTK